MRETRNGRREREREICWGVSRGLWSMWYHIASEREREGDDAEKAESEKQRVREKK